METECKHTETNGGSSERHKKARLEGTKHHHYQQLFSIEHRLIAIRRWIAKPIHSFRDDDGVFRDPRPASIRVHTNTNTNTNHHHSTATEEDTGVLIGNKYHASDVDHLVELGVTAVLNCASGGISRLPMDELREKGIRYGFTNVRQDDLKYPILHDLLAGPQQAHACDSAMDCDLDTDATDPNSSLPELCASQHLKVAKAMYIEEVLRKKGKLLFFCVAGQNRSATLALATLLLRGKATLDAMCYSLSTTRPFVLENEGFQNQLLELERYLARNGNKKKHYGTIQGEKDPSTTMYAHGDYTREDRENQAATLLSPAMSYDTADNSQCNSDTSAPGAVPGEVLVRGPFPDARERVEIELLIPGLCTMEVPIPVPSSISEVKACLIDHTNTHLLKSEQKEVAKSWIVLATFGKDDMYDLPLEQEAIEQSVQWDRLSRMFGLEVEEDSDDPGQKLVHWNSRSRFALVIFSVYCGGHDGSDDLIQDGVPRRRQEPWTFVHRERPGAPATLLSNTLRNTHLRAWDFCDGQAFRSREPIVFCFSDDPRDRRQFMKISTSAQEAQQFHAPGEGGILGMGANAIVHRVELVSTSPKSIEEILGEDGDPDWNEAGNEVWDAAVKRPFSLSKMLASLEAGSEAALGKRLRQLSNRSLLNSDGRVLYFYGLGVALSSNASRPTEYKFEATILARYEEEFSTYTMKRFMHDYTSKDEPPPWKGVCHDNKTADWRNDFSLISVKVLLVSLLNAFRDLTLMGVRAFDFNHLGNVLISRDHQSVKLLDIDGDRRGSIPLSEYQGPSAASLSSLSLSPSSSSQRILYKPCLDVDLNAVLPTVVQQLLLGKGRGTSFVVNTKSEIWRLPPPRAKALVEQTIGENFGPLTEPHMAKVVEWFYAMLKKKPPWGNWTHDIYDAMRCIDHLPVR
eukprot:jgi/Psemu1/65055/estExt_Genemark1.C_1000065